MTGLYSASAMTITLLDVNWMGRPQSIAAALLESDGQRAIVDPGPGSTLATLRERLRSRGMGVADLDSILLASAARLWPDTLHQLFGETLPVPAENLRILQGGEPLKLGARKLDVVYTPGHASHHVSYFDDAEGVAFVGDTTGVRIDNGPYILPATPSPDIDLGIWDKS